MLFLELGHKFFRKGAATGAANHKEGNYVAHGAKNDAAKQDNGVFRGEYDL